VLFCLAFRRRLKNKIPPTRHITNAAALPTPTPAAAPVLSPLDGAWVVALAVGDGPMDEFGDGVAVVVGSAVVDGRLCVLTNVGSAPVLQQVLHVLFAHTQSLSQSFSLLHVSPRQCPSQVHTAWVAVDLGLDVVDDVKAVVAIFEDI
jgi:hypothetical protein